MKGFILTESETQAAIAKVLENKGLRQLLGILNQGGEEARIAGGAVRNALIGESISDVDIATTCLPDEVKRRVEAGGFKCVPTGIAHGTVTVIVEGVPYEVTTLRADMVTDGRRAEVAFGRDWKTDAERRDFTVNGLYADLDGKVIDLLPIGADEVARCEPIYETMPGWSETTFGAKRWEDLPANAQAYLNRLETLCQVPIAIVSTGPERDETILRQHPFK